MTSATSSEENTITNDKLPSVWASRDFPILKTVVEYIDRGQGPDPDEIAKRTGLDLAEVGHGLRALQRRGLVEVEETLGGMGWVTEVSGDAYLVTGLHPDGNDSLEALANMFREAADRTPDPDEKSRLRRAASAVGDLVGQVGAGVMTAYLTRLGGIG